MYDTKSAYLTSLIELQLNRKGYYIQRDVRFGDKWIDAIAESSQKPGKQGSMPNRFAIEYKEVSPGGRSLKREILAKEKLPWLNETLDVFFIYLHPLEQKVEVPNELFKMIKSEQSMIVRKIT